jgi:Flp pilus assembly protein TadG
MTRPQRVIHDAGSVALEAAVLTPALLAVGLLIVAAGRIAVAHTRVEAAAASAARAASLARTLPTGITAARSEAAASLATDHITCSTTSVQVHGNYGAPVGTPASVTVRVTCTAPLADLALPGVPGQRTVSAVATSPLDSWRGRP